MIVITKYGSRFSFRVGVVFRSSQHKIQFPKLIRVPEDKDEMTEQLLKEAKINRRNAKAALTRAAKSLRHLIESKHPGKAVSNVLSKVQKTYEMLILPPTSLPIEDMVHINKAYSA